MLRQLTNIYDINDQLRGLLLQNFDNHFPSIFIYCLEQLINVSDGDEFKTDIESSIRLGLKTIWKSPETSPFAWHCSDSLHDIKVLIETALIESAPIQIVQPHPLRQLNFCLAGLQQASSRTENILFVCKLKSHSTVRNIS